jgi:predicted transcriptional regulator
MSEVTDGRSRPNQVSTRLPDPLLRAVDNLAAEQDRSRSDVIASLVAQSLDMPQAVADRQLDPKLVADAMGRGDLSKQIAAVKTVGAQVFEFDPAGALVIWRYAADLKRQQTSDPKAEASELRHTAARAAGETAFSEASVVLSQRAFDLDPDDPRAASRLGQDLHKAAQQHGDDPELYRQAATVLRHADVDHYARHFLAWSELHVARHDKDAKAEVAAQDALIRVFKEWSYNGTDNDRNPILRQLRRLAQIYGSSHEIVQRAVDATALGPWTNKIVIDDLAPRPLTR